MFNVRSFQRFPKNVTMGCQVRRWWVIWKGRFWKTLHPHLTRLPPNSQQRSQHHLPSLAHLLSPSRMMFPGFQDVFDWTQIPLHYPSLQQLPWFHRWTASHTGQPRHSPELDFGRNRLRRPLGQMWPFPSSPIWRISQNVSLVF